MLYNWNSERNSASNKWWLETKLRSLLLARKFQFQHFHCKTWCIMFEENVYVPTKIGGNQQDVNLSSKFTSSAFSSSTEKTTTFFCKRILNDYILKWFSMAFQGAPSPNVLLRLQAAPMLEEVAKLTPPHEATLRSGWLTDQSMFGAGRVDDGFHGRFRSFELCCFFFWGEEVESLKFGLSYSEKWMKIV